MQETKRQKIDTIVQQTVSEIEKSKEAKKACKAENGQNLQTVKTKVKQTKKLVMNQRETLKQIKKE